MEEITALKKKTIDSNLEDTIEIFKQFYSVPLNKDIIIRNFSIGGLDKKATVIYINSITDSEKIEEHIIRPLLMNSVSEKKLENISPAQLINTYEIYEDILQDINNGNTALFIDGEPKAYVFSSTKFQGRSVEKPLNEVVVKGPKEAFNENVIDNISLLRIKNQK